MQEQLLAQTFVDLAGALVSDVDAVDFLQVLVSGSARLLGTDAAGVLLADQTDQLQVAATSDEPPGLPALMSLQRREGVGYDAYRHSEIVAADLRSSRERWPTFAAAALELGLKGACALPLRIRDTTLGSLTVLRASAEPLDPSTLVLGRALADVAAVGLQQRRALRQAELVADQLQQALDSRVLLEQAKGVLAERLDVDMAEAFRVLRTTARASNTRLSDYARTIVEGPRRQRLPGRPGSGHL